MAKYLDVNSVVDIARGRCTGNESCSQAPPLRRDIEQKDCSANIDLI